MPEQIKNGDIVQVHYTGRLENGEVFDSSTAGEPLSFEVGAGTIIKGFDEGVRDMQVGERKTVLIDANNAYGQRDEALVHSVKRAGINVEEEPQVGMTLMLQLPNNNQIPVMLTEVTDEYITLDANHPLAGQNLVFDIELVGVQE